MTKGQANRIHSGIQKTMQADFEALRAAYEEFEAMEEAFDRKLVWAIHRHLHEPTAVWWEEEGRFKDSCGYRRKVTPECACPEDAP